MEEDKELEEILKRREICPVDNKEDLIDIQKDFTSTNFSEKMDDVNLNLLAQASVEDKNFVQKVTSNIKSAAISRTQVEQQKAELAKQQVDFASETLTTHQEKNKHNALEDKWENKQKRRQYHYNGVLPIMAFVGITQPLNLLLLYLLTIVLLPFFLIMTLVRGTFGAILLGASDSNRSNAVKGFLWTLLAILIAIIIAAGVYLFLKWQNII